LAAIRERIAKRRQQQEESRQQAPPPPEPDLAAGGAKEAARPIDKVQSPPKYVNEIWFKAS